MNWFSVFVGVLLIMMGVSMLLKAMGINLPIMRIVWALFIIFIGVKILFPGTFGRRTDSNKEGGAAVFSRSKVEQSDGGPADYSIAFGSQIVDLTRVDVSKGDVKVAVSAAFGSAEVRVDPKTPVKIVANAAFGHVEWPGGNTAFLGSNTYRSDTYKEGTPALLIEANAAFGSIEIQ